MAIVEIKVPDIGDFAEVIVIELLVKAGDTIKPEQSLITVESDKAAMEIPASQGGLVKELKVKLGDKVKQGSLLLLLEAEASATAPASAQDSNTNQAPASVMAQAPVTQILEMAAAAPAPAPAAASFAGVADLECDLLVLGAGP
ncbi:MAG: biotin/lipoyl-binding protein, partial [Betaproteobacteria bacterium]|nr:biotin/lipoyl-binding protein [Betaproteobacteria bacterium]